MKVPTLSIVGILIISSIPLALATSTGNSSCPYKFSGIRDHTACIPRSSLSISGGITNYEIKLIVDLHNKIRATVTPPSCDMMKMYWDDELAFLAQKWADNCRYNHDKSMLRYIPGRYSVGQNLAKSVGKRNSNWTTVLNEWIREKEAFSYNGANTLAQVSHYIQMVWGESSLIGCGFGKCKDMDLYVCNYGPSGNVGLINIPYRACSMPTDLKDCRRKVCKNGGRFKRGTCDCECKESPQISGPQCDMNCTIKDSSDTCGDKFDCKKVDKLMDCPFKCKVCPYANGSDSFKYWSTPFLVLSVLLPVLMM